MNTPEKSFSPKNVTPEEDRSLTLDQRINKHGDADEAFYVDNEKNATDIQNKIDQEKEAVENITKKAELDARTKLYDDPDEKFYLENEENSAKNQETLNRRHGTGGIGEEGFEPDFEENEGTE